MATVTEDKDLPDWAKPKVKNEPSEVKANLWVAVKKYAFIICSALIIIASLRNSLTWYFERFWGGTKTLWEDVWRFTWVDVFQEDEFMISVAGTSIMSFAHFWLFSLFFFALDVFRPAFFMRYKIQDNTVLDKAKMWKAVGVCLRNQLITFPLCVVPMYYLSIWRGCPFTPEDLPTFKWVLVEGTVFALVEEIGFYYTHRLSHHPALYKHFHKIHHEWTASISIIAVYSHPVEHIISNVMPVFLGPLLMGSHIATFWIWIMIAQASTLNSHCGYHLPFLPSPEAHDYHHLKFTNNFGVLGVLDRLHGTDQNFMKTKAYDRHIMMIGLQPIKDVFPDESKNGVCSRQGSCEKTD